MKKRLIAALAVCLAMLQGLPALTEGPAATTSESDAPNPVGAPEAQIQEIVVDLGDYAGEQPEAQAAEEPVIDDFAAATADEAFYVPYPDVCSSEIKNLLKPSQRVYPGTLVWPLKGTKPLKHVTSHVGWRNAGRIHGNQGGTWPSWLHHGIDVGNVDTSQVVVAADDGQAYAGEKNGCGLYVVIDHGNGWYTEYQHLSRFAGAVTRGCKRVAVKAGDSVGYVGNSGGDYPVHFHFEIAWSPDGGGASDKKYFRQLRKRRIRAYSHPQAQVVELHWPKTWELCTAEAQRFVTDPADMATWPEGQEPPKSRSRR